MKCIRCQQEFDCNIHRGYCDDCVSAFRLTKEGVCEKQRPAPNVFADGKFADENATCPVSVNDPVSGNRVCGLCGSADLEPGYGLGSGFGIGCYMFCCGCDSFLDFCEDKE